MTPADEDAVADAAERRRAHANGRAYAAGCTCDDCMATRCAELRRAIDADTRERWAWWRSLAKRVIRSVMR